MPVFSNITKVTDTVNKTIYRLSHTCTGNIAEFQLTAAINIEELDYATVGFFGGSVNADLSRVYWSIPSSSPKSLGIYFSGSTANANNAMYLNGAYSYDLYANGISIPNPITGSFRNNTLFVANTTPLVTNDSVSLMLELSKRTGYGRNSPAVINGNAVAPVLASAAQRRIDMVCIGDSNQQYNGYGFSIGLQTELARRFGLYATGLIPAGEGGGSGANTALNVSGFQTISGYNPAVVGFGIGFTGNRAPDEADRFLSTGVLGGLTGFNLLPNAYFYVTGGGTHTSDIGYTLNPNGPWNISSAWNFYYTVGIIATSGTPSTNGNHRPIVRLSSSPSTTLTSDNRRLTADTFTLTTQKLFVAADSNRGVTGLQFLMKPPAGQAITGPSIAYYYRAEDVNKQTGLSVHNLYAQGGKSAFDMARSLQNATNETLTEYFKQVRSLQNGVPRVIFRIDTGLNDRNLSVTSAGPSKVPAASGSRGEAFYDNVTAIIDRIEEIWKLNGWDVTETYFLLTSSHAVTASADKMNEYRRAADALANKRSRVTAVDMSVVLPVFGITSNSYYDVAGPDHLTNQGYQYLARREILAILQSDQYNYNAFVN